MINSGTTVVATVLPAGNRYPQRPQLATARERGFPQDGQNVVSPKGLLLERGTHALDRLQYAVLWLVLLLTLFELGLDAF